MIYLSTADHLDLNLPLRETLCRICISTNPTQEPGYYPTQGNTASTTPTATPYINMNSLSPKKGDAILKGKPCSLSHIFLSFHITCFSKCLNCLSRPFFPFHLQPSAVNLEFGKKNYRRQGSGVVINACLHRHLRCEKSGTCLPLASHASSAAVTALYPRTSIRILACMTQRRDTNQLAAAQI